MNKEINNGQNNKTQAGCFCTSKAKSNVSNSPVVKLVTLITCPVRVISVYLPNMYKLARVYLFI